jgi:membrane-bound serine protease (ClpP class)
MKMLRRNLALILLVCAAHWAEAQDVVSITVDGPINPPVADHIRAGIEKATAGRAECLLINLNTPGGLLKSTRVIVSDIMESKVPVVVFVSPSGAHAGSAGVFITMAAHVAAMGPSTNLGSAHPVSTSGQMDSIQSEKATNDAAAFIRSIAEKRGRNADWAEQAVRRSVSLTAIEAVRENVVDVTAVNESDLLRKIDGDTIAMARESVVLKTTGSVVKKMEMSWIQRFLNYISDPNIAYILMLVGIYGLLFEFYSPGIGLPGVAGGICLILAFYAMHTLPLNIAGIALIGLALVLFILELVTPTHGILGIGAAVALLLGSMMLIKPGAEFDWARISLGTIIPAVLGSALLTMLIAGMGLRAQSKKVLTGAEGLVGDTGKALTDLSPAGTVFIQGERWQADSETGFVSKGSPVRVVAVEGLRLRVAADSESKTENRT